jgi:hypothetical protein
MMKTDVQASKSIVNFVKYKAKVVFWMLELGDRLMRRVSLHDDQLLITA